jgi:hypothetical protein
MLYSKIKFIKVLLKDNINGVVHVEANDKLCIKSYIKIVLKIKL